MHTLIIVYVTNMNYEKIVDDYVSGVTTQVLKYLNIDDVLKYVLKKDKNNANVLFLLGRIMKEKNLVDEAIKYYTMASNMGHLMAMNNLGYIYLIEKNDESNALKYYERASDKGNVKAMYNMGSFYEREGNVIKWQ